MFRVLNVTWILVAIDVREDTDDTTLNDITTGYVTSRESTSSAVFVMLDAHPAAINKRCHAW
jgi:hypothetical protein